VILLFWYSFNEYICTCKRLLSCQLLWKDSSANMSRSSFIKLSVYSIRFVIIKTFIKKIFVSTKDSIDSLIFYAKQSHKDHSSRSLEIEHPQDFRISSFHAITWTSTLRIRFCYVRSSDPLESLCRWETTPTKPFGGEKCLIFLGHWFTTKSDPWKKQILQLL